MEMRRTDVSALLGSSFELVLRWVGGPAVLSDGRDVAEIRYTDSGDERLDEER
jgi:hypothetical protein